MEVCPKCKASDSFARIGEFSIKKTSQYGYIIVCRQCNYRKSSFSKKEPPPQDVNKSKEYSYKYAPQHGNYIAPVMPFTQNQQ